VSGRVCTNCGNALTESDIFCQNCGAKQEAPPAQSAENALKPDVKKFCAECGNRMTSDDRFCDECGTEFGLSARTRNVRPARKSGFFARLLKIAAAIATLAAVGCGGFAAYRHFAQGPPAEDISIDVPPEQTAEPAPPEAPTQANEDAEPENDAAEPVEVFAAPDVQTPPPEQTAPIAPPPAPRQPARYSWGAWAPNGYSALSAEGPDGAPIDFPYVDAVITGDRVRFREGPNTKAKIITEFYRDTGLKIFQRYDSGRENYYWFKARSNGVDGWVYGEFLKIENMPEAILPDARGSASHPARIAAAPAPAAGANKPPAPNAGPPKPPAELGDLNGVWVSPAGAFEDANGALYRLSDASLKITVSQRTADAITMTMAGTFVWAWQTQSGEHMFPDNYATMIQRRNALFRKTDAGTYFAAGSEWPPVMFIQAAEGGGFNLLMQDENASYVIGMRRK
jgi:RNA polymerase subunit RPABC4/transcription elongation factor Spt4